MPFALLMILFILALVLLIIPILATFVKIKFFTDEYGDMSNLGKVCLVIGFILAFVLGVYTLTSDSDSFSSKDKDLYDYRSWDYDGDGNLDGKEMKDYQNFKSEMNKERNRRYN